jgi:hypothetical protein
VENVPCKNPRIGRRMNHGFHGWARMKKSSPKTIRVIRAVRGQFLRTHVSKLFPEVSEVLCKLVFGMRPSAKYREAPC